MGAVFSAPSITTHSSSVVLCTDGTEEAPAIQNLRDDLMFICPKSYCMVIAHNRKCLVAWIEQFESLSAVYHHTKTIIESKYFFDEQLYMVQELSELLALAYAKHPDPLHAARSARIKVTDDKKRIAIKIDAILISERDFEFVWIFHLLCRSSSMFTDVKYVNAQPLVFDAPYHFVADVPSEVYVPFPAPHSNPLIDGSTTEISLHRTPVTLHHLFTMACETNEALNPHEYRTAFCPINGLTYFCIMNVLAKQYKQKHEGKNDSPEDIMNIWKPLTVFEHKEDGYQIECSIEVFKKAYECLFSRAEIMYENAHCKV